MPYSLTSSIYLPKYGISRNFTSEEGSWHDIEKRHYYVYETRLASNYTR